MILWIHIVRSDSFAIVPQAFFLLSILRNKTPALLLQNCLCSYSDGYWITASRLFGIHLCYTLLHVRYFFICCIRICQIPIIGPGHDDPDILPLKVLLQLQCDCQIDFFFLCSRDTDLPRIVSAMVRCLYIAYILPVPPSLS